MSPCKRKEQLRASLGVVGALVMGLLAIIPSPADAAGRQLWADLFRPGDTPADVAVSPNGTTVT